MTREGARSLCAALAAIGLLQGWPALADYQSTMDALTRDLPPDAAAMVHRIVDCDHWTSEEPYDADRRAEIEKAIRALDCIGLPRDEAALRQRYASAPAVLDALDRAHDLSE